jgi:hypothetical protein
MEAINYFLLRFAGRLCMKMGSVTQYRQQLGQSDFPTAHAD